MLAEKLPVFYHLFDDASSVDLSVESISFSFAFWKKCLLIPELLRWNLDQPNSNMVKIQALQLKRKHQKYYIDVTLPVP